MDRKREKEIRADERARIQEREESERQKAKAQEEAPRRAAEAEKRAEEHEAWRAAFVARHGLPRAWAILFFSCIGGGVVTIVFAAEYTQSPDAAPGIAIITVLVAFFVAKRVF